MPKSDPMSVIRALCRRDHMRNAVGLEKTLTKLLKMIIDDIKISLINLADALKIFKERDGPANVRMQKLSTNWVKRDLTIAR